MNYFIIIFKNTHDAMSAERILEEKEMRIRIMPTPTKITQSCGICIRVEQRENVDYIISNKIIEFKSIYEKSEVGYVEVI